MSNEVLTQKEETIKGLLVKSKKIFEESIPKHLNAERLIRIATSELNNNYKLQQCEPKSFLGAVLQAGMLGLEISSITGAAYLVPYGNKCQLIIGYKGILSLMKNTGQYSIVARPVYACDEFKYEFGLEKDEFKHVPNFGKREVGDNEWVYNNLTHVYVIARYFDGRPPDLLVLEKKAIEKYRMKSSSQRNPKKPSDVWWEFYEDMALKTGIKRIAKFLPLSSDKAAAISRDDLTEQNIKAFDYSSVVDGGEARELTDAEKTGIIVDEKTTVVKDIPKDLQSESKEDRF